MDQRPSKAWMFMQMALAAKERSTCQRNKVGCVITDEEGMSVVSLGYNGNAAVLTNHCDRPDKQGDCGCIHAEVNALIKAPFREGNLVLYSTTAPCADCAKLIINSAVHEVVFLEPYRLETGLQLLSMSTKRIVAMRLELATDTLYPAWSLA